MITSSNLADSSPERRTVSSTIAAASVSPLVSARVPFPAVPMAVRAALTMTGADMCTSLGLVPYQTLQQQ